MAIKRILSLTLVCTAIGACSPSKPDQKFPDPVQALQAQGVQIMGKFEVPGGLTGYAGTVNHQPVAIYLTADGEHAIVGTLVDADGHAVYRDTLQQIVAGPMSKRVWSQLKHSTWVAEGNADAPRTVYVFSDANCPYCHLFWKKARPWVESGRLQLRHVLVGVISKTSDNKAATILTASDSEHAYVKNQRHFDEGGITPMKHVPEEVDRKLAANFKLMQQLGLHGTPAIVYRNEKGYVQFVRGVPSPQAMKKILGKR